MSLEQTTSREAAVTALFDRHGRDIYGLGLRLCGTPQDAQDLVQETFLLAFRKWDQFRGDAAPSTWLYRIAARACGRRRRTRAGAPARLESLEELLPSSEPGIVEADGPLTKLERTEMKDTIERALQTLPPRFRIPIALKELMELSVAEVAEVLNVRPETVKTRLHRGRLYLAKAVRKQLPRKKAPPADHSKAMCLDLLSVKQDSMDRGVPFPVPQGELCARCRSLFTTLDLTREVCVRLQAGEMPPELRDLVLGELARPSTTRPRRRK